MHLYGAGDEHCWRVRPVVLSDVISRLEGVALGAGSYAGLN